MTCATEVLACRSCRLPLGATDRRRLWLGAATIERTITIGCAVCGAVQHWSPDPPGYSQRRLAVRNREPVVQS